MKTLVLKSLADLKSKQLFGVLVQSVVMTGLLFAALGWGGMEALDLIPEFRWSWANKAASILLGAGLIVGLALLFFPTAALIVGFFLENVAQSVEARNYPDDPAAPGLGLAPSLGAAAKFAGLLILVNLLLVPIYFLPVVNIPVIFLANAYLIGREYFELVALRHINAKQAAGLRSRYRGRVFLSGMIIALALAIPLANLAAPLFGTALMVHLFRDLRAHVDAVEL